MSKEQNKYKKKIIESLISIENIYFQRNERDFSYELYHKLRGLDLDLEVTAETPKGGFGMPVEMLENEFIKKYFPIGHRSLDAKYRSRRTPDLLFHEFGNRNSQELAIEIKSSYIRLNEILADLTKLVFYTKNELKFKKGLMLIYSTNQTNELTNKLIEKANLYLKDFPGIEIWIVTPNKVNIIWANGAISDEFYK